MARKAHKRFSHEQYVKWGREGGSPILLAAKLHRPVGGYKVVRVGKGK